MRNTGIDTIYIVSCSASKHSYLLANEVRISLDAHDRSKVQSPLVKRLTKIGAEHYNEDATVDAPKQSFVRFLTDLNRWARRVGTRLFVGHPQV